MCFSIKETVLSMQYSQQRKTKLCTHHWDNENRQGLINMQRSDWHNTNLLIIFVTLKRNQHYLVICTIKYIILDYISRLSNPRPLPNQLFQSRYQVEGSAECPPALTLIRVGFSVYTLKFLFLAHFQKTGAIMSATSAAPNHAAIIAIC